MRGNSIGAAYVDSRISANLFGPKHRDLLLAFCNQAAIAIDNGRLFADLNHALQKVEEDRQYMDNIFASIANGVITTDPSGIITKFNDAAGLILGINPISAVGRHYRQVFQHLPQLGIAELLSHTPQEQEQHTILPRLVECEIPERGPGLFHLMMYPSALRDGTTPIGMALVIDDRTEQRRAEANAKDIRRIFGSYVHPNVFQQLIENPSAIELGGEVKEISVIAVGIRGFAHFSDRMPSREVVNILNTYLDIMLKAIWEENGTVTRFGSDSLTAIFNAPTSQEDHALCAVRAAWRMRAELLEFERTYPQELPPSFVFGVNTGLAIVGNIGSQKRMQNYTAFGDAVDIAVRLESHAADNTILLNHSTFVQVRRYVRVTKLPPPPLGDSMPPFDGWRLEDWTD